MKPPKVFDIKTIKDTIETGDTLTLCGLKGRVQASSTLVDCYYIMHPTSPGRHNSQYFVEAGIIDDISKPESRNFDIEEYLKNLLGPKVEPYVSNGYFPEIPMEMLITVINDLELRYAMKNGYKPFKTSKPNVIKAW